MPFFQSVSSITLNYRGSALAHATGNLVGDAGVELMFGGPRWLNAGGFVDEVLPFQLLTISAAGQISDISSSLPAGVGAVHARELVLADFNKDGRLDAFSANHGFDGGGFPGEGQDLFFGGQAGATSGTVPALTDFVHSADVGDVDGDGDLDILVGAFGTLGTSATGPYILKNDGAGGFTKDSSGLVGQTLDGLASTKLVDVDGDGDLDMVGGNHGASGSAGWVWKNNGAGVFANDTARALPEGGFGARTITLDIAAIDFDGDGDQDLIASQTRYDPFYSGSRLQFLENDGTGRFTDVTAQRMAAQDTTAGWSDKIYTVDLNGDGYLDLVTSRPQGGSAASIALNDGNGRFFYIDAGTTGASGSYLTPLDFDGDGRIDLVSFSRDIPSDQPLTVSVLKNTGFLNVTPTAGADTILGGQGKDSVEGGAGDDLMLGGGDQDFLWGGDGADVISGGDAFDNTHGNMGNDTVHGGRGDDWVVGGKDNDQLFGDSGIDVVWGNIGGDTIRGGDDRDQVRGGQGDDIVYGDGGSDYVSGDRGADTVYGGAGADFFHGSQDQGVDRIMDFSLAEGDRMLLDPGTTYTVSQVGADTVLDMGGGNQMILVGVQLSTLGATSGWIIESYAWG